MHCCLTDYREAEHVEELVLKLDVPNDNVADRTCVEKLLLNESSDFTHNCLAFARALFAKNVYDDSKYNGSRSNEENSERFGDRTVLDTLFSLELIFCGTLCYVELGFTCVHDCIVNLFQID